MMITPMSEFELFRDAFIEVFFTLEMMPFSIFCSFVWFFCSYCVVKLLMSNIFKRFTSIAPFFSFGMKKGFNRLYISSFLFTLPSLIHSYNPHHMRPVGQGWWNAILFFSNAGVKSEYGLYFLTTLRKLMERALFGIKFIRWCHSWSFSHSYRTLFVLQCTSFYPFLLPPSREFYEVDRWHNISSSDSGVNCTRLHYPF